MLADTTVVAISPNDSDLLRSASLSRISCLLVIENRRSRSSNDNILGSSLFGAIFFCVTAAAGVATAGAALTVTRLGL